MKTRRKKPKKVWQAGELGLNAGAEWYLPPGYIMRRKERRVRGGLPPSTPVIRMFAKGEEGRGRGWYASIVKHAVPWIGPFSRRDEARELGATLHLRSPIWQYIKRKNANEW